MRTYPVLLLLTVSLLLVGACAATQPDVVPAEYRVTSTIKDIMDSMVDTGADFLWESVATIVSAAGTEERRPKTDMEWLVVRRNAIMLIEATNLLQMPGRHVAKPGEKSENPEVELGPEEIEKLISQDRKAFINFAHALHDAGMTALAAIDAKNAEGLLDAGEKIDTACENCHLKYWYPESLQAASAAKKPSPRKQ